MLHERKRRVDDRHGARRIEAILDAAGAVEHIFAAGGPWAFRAYVGLFADRRMPPFELAARGPDTADHLLLDRGEFLADIGYSEFFIASRDGIFAPFADSHCTTIITPTLRGLSQALRLAAQRVEVLRCG